MQGKNHVGLALAAPFILALAGAPVPFPATLTAWCYLVVGSLAPDIDGGGTIARPSKFLPDIIPGWLDKTLDKIGLKIARVIQALFGHRGGLHWPLWGGLMIWAGGRYELEWLFWFGAGYLLHIAGDVITRAGVPLLGPLIARKISLFPMRTGGRLEGFISFGLWVFVLWQVALIVWPSARGVINSVSLILDRINYLMSVR